MKIIGNQWAFYNCWQNSQACVLLSEQVSHRASSVSLASHPYTLCKEYPDAFSFQHDVMRNEKTCRACCSQTRQMISSPSWAFPGYAVQKEINKMCNVQFTGGKILKLSSQLSGGQGGGKSCRILSGLFLQPNGMDLA